MMGNMKQRAFALLAAFSGLLFFIALLFFFVGGTQGSAYFLKQSSAHMGMMDREKP